MRVLLVILTSVCFFLGRPPRTQRRTEGVLVSSVSIGSVSDYGKLLVGRSTVWKWETSHSKGETSWYTFKVFFGKQPLKSEFFNDKLLYDLNQTFCPSGFYLFYICFFNWYSNNQPSFLPSYIKCAYSDVIKWRQYLPFPI